MTHPPVDNLPEQAAVTLLGVCGQLSQSRHRGLARWATSVSDSLLARLVSVTTGVCVDSDAEPCQRLAQLDAVEPTRVTTTQLSTGAPARTGSSLPTSTAACASWRRSTPRPPSSRPRNGDLHAACGQRRTSAPFRRGRGCSCRLTDVDTATTTPCSEAPRPSWDTGGRAYRRLSEAVR
jgi:hypothetical protein